MKAKIYGSTIGLTPESAEERTTLREFFDAGVFAQSFWEHGKPPNVETRLTIVKAIVKENEREEGGLEIDVDEWEWVYIQSGPNLYTVGFYSPDGEWHTDNDWTTPEEAAARAHYLNVGKYCTPLRRGNKQ